MKTSPISNFSLGAHQAKTQKINKNVNRDNYYKWVSQNQANQALKMVKGREVENGKFEAAKAISSLTAFAAGLFTAVNATRMIDIKPVTPEMKKLSRNNMIGLAVTAIALNARNVIEYVNNKRADKTANERGFMTTGQMNRVQGTDNIYKVANSTYKKNIK